MRASKEAKRRALSHRKRRLLQFIMKNKLSLIPRIFSVRLVNTISLSLEKFERKPWEVGRARSREWWDRDVQEMDEEEFRQNFRLSRGAFNKLCDRLDPLVGKQEAFARNTVSTPRRVAITLHYLGQGANYRVVANQFGVAVSTVCVIVKETTAAIVQSMTPEMIHFPDTNKELLAAMLTFDDKFPNCVGAIDGSHIQIQRPKEHGTDYYNRKGYYSILLQAVCDGSAKFWSVSCGHPGSIHDARMLKRSALYRNVQSKRSVNIFHTIQSKNTGNKEKKQHTH